MNAEKQNPANMITTTAAVIPSCHFERRVVASDLPFEVSAGDEYGLSIFESDNGNVHRAAANIIVSKSRAARGSVCNVLLSRDRCVKLSAASRVYERRNRCNQRCKIDCHHESSL